MIIIFKLTSDQKQILKDWSNRQSDSEYFEWYNRQRKDSEEFNEILEKTKFKEGYDLTLEELYVISDLLTADLGNTALSIKGENSIFEKNDLSIFNARLRNLLFGENKLSERVNSFVTLKGVGIMTVSQFLCLFDHKKYAFFSGYMESVFNKTLLIENNQYEDSKNQSKEEFLLRINTST